MIRSYDRFNFGKYRDCRVEDVARRDPSYIWYIENSMGHRFSPAVKRTARYYADRSKYYRTGGDFY